MPRALAVPPGRTQDTPAHPRRGVRGCGRVGGRCEPPLCPLSRPLAAPGGAGPSCSPSCGRELLLPFSTAAPSVRGAAVCAGLFTQNIFPFAWAIWMCVYSPWVDFLTFLSSGCLRSPAHRGTWRASVCSFCASLRSNITRVSAVSSHGQLRIVSCILVCA